MVYSLFAVLIQQPSHAINSVGVKLQADLKLRKHAVEAVRDARIHVKLGLDTKVLSKNPFVHQPFVTKRVHSKNLQVGGWKSAILINAEHVV
jgi:hypothetical protein